MQNAPSGLDLIQTQQWWQLSALGLLLEVIVFALLNLNKLIYFNGLVHSTNVPVVFHDEKV